MPKSLDYRDVALDQLESLRNLSATGASMLSGHELKAKADEKIYNAKGAFSSWKAFQAWVQVPSTALDQVRQF